MLRREVLEALAAGCAASEGSPPEFSERERRLLRDDTVSEHPQSVQPEGHPISASTKSGLKARVGGEVGSPAFGVVGAWRERSATDSRIGVFLARSLGQSDRVESLALGVGQRCAIASSSCPRRCPGFDEPFPSCAPGVGQFTASLVRCRLPDPSR